MPRLSVMMDYRFATLALLMIAAFGLSACNTIEGAGRDLSKAGEKISEAADEVRDEL